MIQDDELGTALAHAETKIASGRFGEARITLTTAAERFPENPWPIALLGRVALAEGCREEGIAHILRALKTGAPHPAVFGLAAQLLFAERDPAVDEFVREGVRLFPRDAPLLRLAILRGRASARPRERRVIAVFGNCQAEAIHSLASDIPFLAERFRFVMIASHVPAGSSRSAMPKDIELAEMLWEQQGDHADGPLCAEMHRRLPANCSIVRFPPIGLFSCWPFAYSKYNAHPEPGLAWGRYPLGDRIADATARLQLPADRAYDAYMRLSREKMPELQRLLERDRHLMKQAEARCDIKIADYVVERFQTQRLFLAWHHPSILMMSEILSHLYSHCAQTLGCDAGIFDAQLQAVLDLARELSPMEVPIHPDVIERLHITHLDADSRYRWFGNAWTFSEYVTRYITDDRSWQPTRGIESTCTPVSTRP